MLFQWIIKIILGLLPSVMKFKLLKLAATVSARLGGQVHHNIYRLPFNLVLKSSPDTHANEAHALRLVNSFHGIHAPRLIDYAFDTKRSYVLMTWIKGDCCSDVWQLLLPSDKDRIALELRAQLKSLRGQTVNRQNVICAASGQPIFDPRVPWVQENPRLFSSCPAFFEQVWLGLDFPQHKNTLRPVLRPLIERQDIPIVFCHGDILPKNLILPGGLEKWRVGDEPVALIDWEYAGWMPLPWEALKATWMVFDPADDEWYSLMRNVFQEFHTELEADWLWRSTSGITII